MVTPKLIGEADGHIVSREFHDEGDAIRWLNGAGLVEFEDQTALGEVWIGGKLVWTRAHLQTPDSKERERIRYATRWLASQNLTSWKSKR